LSVGVPCTVNNLDGPRVGQTMTGAEAQALIQREWKADGGINYKAWQKNDW
jgi:hypothetical protein